jgi:hypothetical protein
MKSLYICRDSIYSDTYFDKLEIGPGMIVSLHNCVINKLHIPDAEGVVVNLTDCKINTVSIFKKGYYIKSNSEHPYMGKYFYYSLMSS